LHFISNDFGGLARRSLGRRRGIWGSMCGGNSVKRQDAQNLSSADCKACCNNVLIIMTSNRLNWPKILLKTSAQKNTLQTAISTLKSKISGLTAQINQSTVMVKDLNIQISDTQDSISKTTNKNYRFSSPNQQNILRFCL